MPFSIHCSTSNVRLFVSVHCDLCTSETMDLLTTGITTTEERRYADARYPHLLSGCVGSCRIDTMTPTTASPAAKALKYAEEQLGVHEVYNKCLAVREALDATLTELSKVRDKKRETEDRLLNAELEVAADERGKHPEMSAAAMEKHMKVALHNSGNVREFRHTLAEVVGELEGLDFDKTMHET